MKPQHLQSMTSSEFFDLSQISTHARILHEVAEFSASLSEDDLNEGFRDFVNRARDYGKEKIQQFVGYLKKSYEYLVGLLKVAAGSLGKFKAYIAEKRRLRAALKELQAQSRDAREFQAGMKLGDKVRAALEQRQLDEEFDAMMEELDAIIARGEIEKEKTKKLLARYETKKLSEASDLVSQILMGVSPEEIAEGILRDTFSKLSSAATTVKNVVVSKFLAGVSALATFFSKYLISPLNRLVQRIKRFLATDEEAARTAFTGDDNMKSLKEKYSKALRESMAEIEKLEIYALAAAAAAPPSRM